MKFAKICNLDMLSELCLEFNDKGEGGCSDGAVIDMYDDNDNGFVTSFDENSLVNLTLLESEISDEYFN